MSATRLLPLSLTAGLALACGVTAAVAAEVASGPWEIGPVIRGRNYSQGMPPAPVPAGRGWMFDFPGEATSPGSIHYVTLRTGPLEGARGLIVRYRIDAAPGVRFVPQEKPGEPATVSLMFQRAGDSWSGKRHEFHRWYAPTATVRELGPGRGEIVVNLDDAAWISVFGRPASQFPEAFADALSETERVGLVFGSAGARGHGVYATGPARFRLDSFRIE
jgi:hypothetical protein